VPLLVKTLKLRIEEHAKGRVGYPPLPPNFMIVFVFPRDQLYDCVSVLKHDLDYAVLSLIFLKKISLFQKVDAYDPLRKWMDNCYRGVPLGGIGSVSSAFYV
jgi:hypothetical protein